MQSNPIGDKGHGVLYGGKLFLYWVTAAVVGFFVARWLSPLGLVVNLICAVAAAYLTILVGRRIFGRPEGL